LNQHSHTNCEHNVAVTVAGELCPIMRFLSHAIILPFLENEFPCIFTGLYLYFLDIPRICTDAMNEIYMYFISRNNRSSAGIWLFPCQYHSKPGFLTLQTAKCQVRDEVGNLNTKKVITCCLSSDSVQGAVVVKYGVMEE
jgi:hypothetical protein